jgi:hypothetical protein
VGLTSDEALGRTALLAQSDDLNAVEIPEPTGESSGWRSYSNEPGALHDEYALPRGTASADVGEPVSSVLDGADEDYVLSAATTADDLAILAPKVPESVL